MDMIELHYHNETFCSSLTVTIVKDNIEVVEIHVFSSTEGENYFRNSSVVEQP